ncbi:hypothetical protein Rsub_04240 [Raphidocelis subcapitata]|uniref:Uncharacterized protein n=1 Tax=Raphidocelis subcapitata TaxID=307507 RepID=A0A2V0P0Z4_9CHLO|nr:hypothetical protein Rsub_04240 [Raphidocelis subcapitata]|eukprot:GBF91500.1 hypothetical protein Rsub_04240 [Raphidocelis subcapitata]
MRPIPSVSQRSPAASARSQASTPVAQQHRQRQQQRQQQPPLLRRRAAGAPPAAAAEAAAAAAAAVEHGSTVLPWLPAFALLALSWQGPRLASAAADFLKPRKCRTCWGAGYTLCDACGARGKRGGAFEGGPLVPCPACAGRGRLQCTACNATGLANSWLWKPSNDPGWGARGE